MRCNNTGRCRLLPAVQRAAAVRTPTAESDLALRMTLPEWYDTGTTTIKYLHLVCDCFSSLTVLRHIKLRHCIPLHVAFIATGPGTLQTWGILARNVQAEPKDFRDDFLVWGTPNTGNPCQERSSRTRGSPWGVPGLNTEAGKSG